MIALAVGCDGEPDSLVANAGDGASHSGDAHSEKGATAEINNRWKAIAWDRSRLRSLDYGVYFPRPPGGRAAMSESQKKASAYISFAALLLATVVSVWLASLAATATFAAAHPGREEPSLLESWTAIVWFMKSSTSAKVIYGGLLTILTIGAGVLGELYKSTRVILFLAVLCLVGIAACTTVMIEVAKPENLTTFRYYADYDEPAHLESDVNILFGALIGWFTSFLATQLGIRLAVNP